MKCKQQLKWNIKNCWSKKPLFILPGGQFLAGSILPQALACCHLLPSFSHSPFLHPWFFSLPASDPQFPFIFLMQSNSPTASGLCPEMRWMEKEGLPLSYPKSLLVFFKTKTHLFSCESCHSPTVWRQLQSVLVSIEMFSHWLVSQYLRETNMHNELLKTTPKVKFKHSH